MSCIRSSDSDEPEFEPVTLRHPALANTIAAATRMLMPSANSSPKLRLEFAGNDSLMTDADFYGILNHRDERGKSASQVQHHDRGGERVERSRPVLPPSPALTGSGGGNDNAKFGTPHELQRQLSHLGIDAQFRDRSAVERANMGDDTGQLDKNVEVKRRPVPRPVSILPRDGTVTALPGSTMESAGDDGYRGGGRTSPALSTTASTTTTNTSVSASTILMPPPPLPATPTPNSKHYSRPFRPATPLSIPATSGTPSAQEHNPIGKHIKKRKLSINAPILQNVKRILTPSTARKRSGLSITHLTHEETAVNRGVGGVGAGPDTGVGSENGRSTPIQENNNDSFGGEKTSTSASTPIPHQDRRDTEAQQSRSTTPTVFSPASQTMRHMSSIKRTILHPFKSHRRTTTSDSANTAYTQDEALAPSEAGSQVDPTSKSALNALIIRLRSQISDLTLENRVLKDQIAIVRKDWIDTARELDVERHRLWEAEMEAFRNGVGLEEMRAEMVRLKRGSVVD